MMISVEHSTFYRYDHAVLLEPHTFRLRPRMTTTQRLLAFDLELAPEPIGTSESLDQDGNLALHAWFTAPVTELRVTSRFRVELVRDNPFDYNLPVESETLPMRYAYPLSASLASYSNALSVDEPVRRFSRLIAAEAQGSPAAFLTALNQQIYNSFEHVIRPEGAARTSGQTLELLEGSCRDLAILFCDACRSMGLASRFVSGYECASAGTPDASMHAWAEVYLPAAGWRGYDPSRGLLVANRHVAVAAAFHPDLASPVAGAFTGTCGSQMETRLLMEVIAR